jgi:outer membrane protein
MKTITRIFISVVIISTQSIVANAQESLKLGHVNIPEILQKLPETDSIQEVMKKESNEMEKMFGDMIKEHESALQKYETEKESYSEFIRNSKEKELMEMSAKIQQFQQTANDQLQKRNMELVQPIYSKINKAIN